MEEPREEGQDVPTDDDEDKPDEIYCFLDGARVCGGDCMAYHGFPRENKELENNQKSCVLLQSAERTGRNISILAGVVHKFVELSTKDIVDRQNQEMDKARGAGPQPPSPTGTA